MKNPTIKQKKNTLQISKHFRILPNNLEELEVCLLHKFFKLLLETTLATINARVLTLIKKGTAEITLRPLFPPPINFIRRSLRASTGALSQITLSGRAFPPVEFSRITHFEMISDFGGSCKDVMDKCLYLSTLLCYLPHVNLVSLIFPHSICLSIASPSPLFLSFSRASLLKSVVLGTDTIHLYCHISKIHLYYFFLLLDFFFILTQPNLRFKNIFY
jgi:hypothetical protein